MISNEALADRKWGRYPELRKLFEKHPVPPEVYGRTSVSDNTPARIGRLIEIVATIQANMKDLEAIAPQSKESSTLLDELHTLKSEIRHATNILTNLGNELNGAAELLHRAAAAQEDEYRRKLLAVRAIEENRDAQRSGEPSEKQEE
jgi:hypothetical protein